MAMTEELCRDRILTTDENPEESRRMRFVHDGLHSTKIRKERSDTSNHWKRGNSEKGQSAERRDERLCAVPLRVWTAEKKRVSQTVGHICIVTLGNTRVAGRNTINNVDDTCLRRRVSTWSKVNILFSLLSFYYFSLFP